MNKIIFAFFLLLSCGLSAQQGFSISRQRDTLYLVRTDTIREGGTISLNSYLRPFADSATLNGYLIDQANALLTRAKQYEVAARADNEIARRIVGLADQTSREIAGRKPTASPVIFPPDKPPSVTPEPKPTKPGKKPKKPKGI